MNKKQEIKLCIKWVAGSITVCAILGVLIAYIQIMFLEQTNSGTHAVHNECVLWDEECLNSCQEADDPYHPPLCECCIHRKDVVSPLGKRIGEVAKLYSLAAGSLGLTIGLTIFDQKIKKLRMRS